MQRIRIKKAPQKGDQRDYSLYDRSTLNPGPVDSSEQVKNTMGPVDREDANIEVERGEVVVGDTNQDGFLELFTFTGKRHSQGGTPVNIPPGSFIFSDTRKLRIKDEQLLKTQFGLSMKKGGYTPAEIAKKFQINEYVADLKSQDTDNLTKRSADRMLKNNLGKLGVLALIQESMKGFPDGIPAIAESAMAGLQQMMPQMQAPQQSPMQEMQETPQEEAAEPMQEVPEQEMPMQRYGGMAKYENAGPVKKATPGQPYLATFAPYADTLYPSDFMRASQAQRKPKAAPPAPAAPPANGMSEQQAQNLLKQLVAERQAAEKSGDVNAVKMVSRKMRQAADQVSKFNNAAWYSAGFIPGTDQFNFDVITSQLRGNAENLEGIIIPRMEMSSNISAKLPELVAKYQPIYDKINRGEYVDVDAKELAKMKQIFDLKNHYDRSMNDKGYSVMPLQTLQGYSTYLNDLTGTKAATPTANANQVSKTKGSANAAAMQSTVIDTSAALTDPNGNPRFFNAPPAQPAAPKPAQPAPQAQPVKTTTSATPVAKTPAPAAAKKAPATDQDLARSLGFAYGGYVPMPKYVDAGTTKESTEGPIVTNKDLGKNTAPDPNQEVFVQDAALADGTPVKVYIRGNMVVTKNADGTVRSEIPRRDISGDRVFTQYGKDGDRVKSIVKDKPVDVRYTNINLGQFGTQKPVAGQGTYGALGKGVTPEMWQDFKDRHGDWIDEMYVSPSGEKGFEGFRNDVLRGRDSSNKATNWFQNTVNKLTTDEFGSAYFSGDPIKDPYGVDSKFGNVVFSTPRFFKMKTPPSSPPPPPPPHKDPNLLQKFYCVEDAEGNRSVQKVDYKEGEIPVAPTGAKVTEYPTYVAAQVGCVKEGTTIETPRKPKVGPWYLQDTNNFVGAMTDKINRYNPMLSQITPEVPGYVLNDPTRMLAANQEQMAEMNNLLGYTQNGNVAAATALGASGKGFENAANVLAQVENSNVGVVNNAAANAAQIRNNANTVNAAARHEYMQNLATLNQNFDNAKQEKKWRVIGAFNNGLENHNKKQAIEQVLFPQVYQDPISGMFEFSDNARNPFGPDTYSPFYANNTKANAAIDPDAIYKSYTAAGYKPEDALALTKLRVDAYSKTGDPSTTARQQYAQMMGFQFGGAITPWDLD